MRRIVKTSKKDDAHPFTADFMALLKFLREDHTPEEQEAAKAAFTAKYGDFIPDFMGAMGEFSKGYEERKKKP
jgi:hypothetical protein